MTTIRKLGVLGLGEGRSVLSAAQSSPYWEIGKLCDLNEALGAHRVEEFSLEPDLLTTSYENMLSDNSIDAIGIYTPDPLHAKHIHMALDAGKHVLVTKPAITNLADAPLLLEKMKAAQRQVFVGQSSRFFEPMIHQRQDYENGKNGQLTAVETFYKTDARWFLEKQWSLAGGFSWMLNFMIHAMDLACWYLDEITTVYAMGHSSANTLAKGLNAPDVIKVLLQDKNGVIGQIEGQYTSPALGQECEPSISCTLRGTEGISRGEYMNLLYHTHFADEAALTHSYEHLHAHYFRFEGKSHHAGEYQNYLDHFALALEAGKTASPGLEEAVQILRIMKAAETSMMTGLPIHYPFE